MKKYLVYTVLCFLMVLILLNLNLEAQKILFKSNFSDIKTKWEIIDDPKAKKSPSNWQFGLVEMSGISTREKNIATAILAGDKTWQNYTVETSLHMASYQGNLIGIVFGYQDPEHFFMVGYNFTKHRFECVARAPEGFEMLAFYEIDILKAVEIPLRLDYAGERIRFSANNQVIFDLNDSRYPRGQFGLGASELKGSKIIFGPVTVKSLNPSTLPARKLQDLLAQGRGAQVVSEKEKGPFQALIDHTYSLEKQDSNPGSAMTFNIQKTQLPIEGIYAFPQEKSFEIHSIGLQLEKANFPGEVEFLVSEQNQAGKFHSIGKFHLKPETKSYQEFNFDQIKAKYLKLKLLTATEKTNIQLSEMFVYGYQSGSGALPGSSVDTESAAEAKILFRDDYSSGKIDKWQIWYDPKANKKPSQWAVVLSEFSNIYNALDNPATFLVTGEQNWSNYSIQVDVNAVRSDGNLSGLVFGFQSSDNYYIAGYNVHRSRFELGKCTPAGFEILAYAKFNYLREKWLPLRADVYGNRIYLFYDNRLIIHIDDTNKIEGRIGIGTSALGYGAINFREFTATSIDNSSIPQKQLQDLLSSKRGASVIYKKSIPKSDRFADLLDHELLVENKFGSTYNLDLSKDPLPEEAVFCFPQGRFVEIHSIGFRLGRENFPQEIKLWTSNQTPKSGFKPLISISLQSKSNSYQEFPVEPVKAKYLKMEITESSSGKRLTINEMFVKGYFMELAVHQAGKETLGEVQIREKEPNNSSDQAQALPLNTFLGGKASKEDVDFYKLTVNAQSGNTLTLSINNLGMLRPGYSLLTEDRIKIDPFKEVVVENTIEVTYQLTPANYYLKVNRPESYLTIVYDDSGSMRFSVETVKRILGNYLDNLPKGLNLQLMKYTDQPHFLSDFTFDSALLKQALEKEVRGGGGTDTFKGLGAAVGSVSKQNGNRAVLAIFDVIDCSGRDCSQTYLNFWDSILDSGISFSTIAVRHGWDMATPYFQNSRQQIFKEIAYASNGQFYYSPSVDKVKESAETIFKQLTSPVEYRIRAELTQTEKKSGSVQVLFEKGEEKKAAQNIELILDASNSMWGQIEGEAKITIAKKVLEEIIKGLPDEMNVGLRLYGHRYKLQDSRACQDTELITSIGPINKNKLVSAVNAITPRGKTPLVYSVLEGIKDFKTLKSGTIVLISDGVESCDGDINSIAPALKEAGLNLQVNIVGFDIKEMDARQQLESIASSTGGVYLDAKDSNELLSSLQQTLKVEYVLIDETGKIKVRGSVGEKSIQVIEGDYILKLLLQPEPLELKLTIKPDRNTVLTLKKDGENWSLVRQKN